MESRQKSLHNKIMKNLGEALPEVFSRKAVPSLFGESISVGTLANLASEGYGPPATRNGRNTIYEKESFLEWFALYLRGGVKLIKESYYRRE